MVDFKKLIENAEKVRQERNRSMLKKFGSIEPSLTDLCSRCGEQAGKHYIDDICPDEWIAQGHHLSPY